MSTRSKYSVSPNPRMLRMSEVARWLGVSRTTIYKWIRDGFLPQPIILGGQNQNNSASRWREDEIQAWLDSRPVGRIEDDQA